VMSTSYYTGLTPFNFIRKHFLQICVRKVAVHLQKVLEVTSTSVYTGLNPFNFIRKHSLQICVRKVAVHLQKLLEVMSTSVYTGSRLSASFQTDSGSHPVSCTMGTGSFPGVKRLRRKAEHTRHLAPRLKKE
jgi:hypothetical protein